MKTIKKFVTEDGQEFTDERDARRHEIFLSLRGVLQSLPGCGNPNAPISMTMVAKAILTGLPEFSEEFSRIKRRLSDLERSYQKTA